MADPSIAAEAFLQRGAIVVAKFTTKRKHRWGGGEIIKTRGLLGEVQRVTETRVLVQTLKTGFFGFSKTDRWAPKATVKAATPAQVAKWKAAIAECDALVRAFREAHVGEGESHG